MSSPPLVSIITATYNAAATLEACLASVRAQDYPALEHIVIDGASTDATRQILQAHHTSLAATLSEPDRGVYDAWNKGLALARGEWIAFLGADDRYLSGAVSAYMEAAARNPDAEFLCSRVRWVLPTGHSRLIGSAWAWPRFQRYMCTAHVGSMHRRSLFTRFGQYDQSYRIVADYEFLLRSRQHLRAAFLPQVTVAMQAGGMSDSYAGLKEAARAKRITGGRRPVVANLEWGLAKLGLFLRRTLSPNPRKRSAKLSFPGASPT